MTAVGENNVMVKITITSNRNTAKRKICGHRHHIWRQYTFCIHNLQWTHVHAHLCTHMQEVIVVLLHAYDMSPLIFNFLFFYYLLFCLVLI